MQDETIIGIDEAGMGPVFGPVVVCGAAVRKSDLDRLASMGVRDSKSFGAWPKAHHRRESICRSAASMILDHKQVAIEPELIRSGNLYKLHVDAVRTILQALGWQRAGTVYIEQVGGLKRKNFLTMLGFWHSGFVYEEKADCRYTAVSLASMLAKTRRDSIVKKLCEDMGEEYVSGYANSATEGLLTRYYEKNGHLPPGTRTSYAWAPIVRILKEIDNGGT